jgi:hypothetical protein
MSVLDSGMEEILTYNERNVCDDLDWSGLASFKFVSSPRACEGWGEDLSWSLLDRYLGILNYKPEQYACAKAASMQDWEKQVDALSVQSSQEIKEYYSQLISFFVEISDRAQEIRGNLQTKPVDDEFVEQIKETTSRPWNYSSLPGADPASWPFSLDSLLERLEQCPPLMLWLEPFDLHSELMDRISSFVRKHEEDLVTSNKALKVMLLLAYLSGNGTKLAAAYAEVWEFCQRNQVSEEFVQELSQAVAKHVELIKKIISAEGSAHFAKPGSLLEKFSAAQNSRYQKNQNCWNTSTCWWQQSAGASSRSALERAERCAARFTCIRPLKRRRRQLGRTAKASFI